MHDRHSVAPLTGASPMRALASLLLMLAACHRSTDAASEQAPVPVVVRAVSEPTEIHGARYSGTIEPATRVDVAFRVSGYVGELLRVKASDGRLRTVQEGDVVSSGTVLAVVRQGEYLEKVAAANAQLAQAKATAGQAKTEWDRTRRLVASNAVPAAELDESSSRLDVAQALVSGAEAQVRDARLLLNDTSLRAPISGVVLKRAIEPGAFVAAGSTVFAVADTSNVKFVFGAPDSLVGHMAEGSKLTVHVKALDNDVEGVITRIAPSADAKTHVFDIEITIPNPDGRLKPGFVASIGLSTPLRDGPPIALPLTGVVRSSRDPRGFAVFVITEEAGNSVAHLRDVKLGAIIGNEVQVLSGLQKGDRIVSVGATLLVDGAHVRILPS